MPLFMVTLLATVQKEFLLLRRDIHGLLLLFIMPLMFILIMSLALQNQFAETGGSKIDVLVKDQVATPQSEAVLAQLRTHGEFNWQKTELSSEQALKDVGNDKAAFFLQLNSRDGYLLGEVVVAPSTNPQTEAILTATVSEAITRNRVEALLVTLKQRNPSPGMLLMATESKEEAVFRIDPVTVRYSYKKTTEDQGRAPTSVQQSVPAWLVFAMFFSVVPLSNALINERQQGTLRRLRTMPVSPFLPIFGKLIPYFFINQIQVLLMLAVGVYVMPWFGADSLTLGNSIAGLMLMAAALSVAALGYGILIAVVARTTDQATTLGGTGNIILAAIGGIMVPRFVMPEMMQEISQWSPMAWGLEGFLDILLRNGSVIDVLPEAGALLLFGSLTIGLSLLLSLRKYY